MIKKIIKWTRENSLFVIGVFLLGFIPLYRKIPLFSPIEQYTVRARVEDIFILSGTMIWIWLWFRKKIRWNSPIFWMIVIYSLVGLASTFSAIYITQTVPQEPLHVAKTVLHYFRYLEYFSLFLILFSSIKKKSQVYLALAVLSLTVIAISVYGYGQRYYYWPVYSTMNREFSKGVQLTLSERARVQSTFGGHYDMGGYLVVMLPLMLSGFFLAKKKYAKYGFLTAFVFGTWLIILSASRMPFASYLAGVGIVLLILFIQQKNWSQRMRFALKPGLGILLTIALIFYYFGGSMAERITFLLNNSQYYQELSENIAETSKSIGMNRTLAWLPTPKQVQEWLPKGEKPLNTISTDDIIAASRVKKDIPALTVGQVEVPSGPAPVVAPPTTGVVSVPADIIEEAAVYVEEITISETGEEIITRKKKVEVYSDCALDTELSLCIRMEVLWPQAMEGFLNYPLLGSGYATLTKTSVDQFTEGDSTDNNYLRTLGETGALGFLTFYGIIGIVIGTSFVKLNSKDNLTRLMSTGLFASTIGLMMNAIYIDVFVASKIAQSYWALVGLYFGYIYLEADQNQFKKFSRKLLSLFKMSNR